jgi:hypothetical protein
MRDGGAVPPPQETEEWRIQFEWLEADLKKRVRVQLALFRKDLESGRFRPSFKVHEVPVRGSGIYAVTLAKNLEATFQFGNAEKTLIIWLTLMEVEA